MIYFTSILTLYTFTCASCISLYNIHMPIPLVLICLFGKTSMRTELLTEVCLNLFFILRCITKSVILKCISHDSLVQFNDFMEQKERDREKNKMRKPIEHNIKNYSFLHRQLLLPINKLYLYLFVKSKASYTTNMKSW